MGKLLLLIPTLLTASALKLKKMAGSEKKADGKPIAIEGSYAQLFNAYDFDFAHQIYNWSDWHYYSDNPSGNGSNVLTSPLYILNMGVIRIVGISNHIGERGYLWSSTSQALSSSYAVYTNPIVIYPAILSNSNEGNSLRCLIGNLVFCCKNYNAFLKFY